MNPNEPSMRSHHRPGPPKGPFHKWRHPLTGKGDLLKGDVAPQAYLLKWVTVKGGGAKISKSGWRHLWTVSKWVSPIHLQFDVCSFSSLKIKMGFQGYLLVIVSHNVFCAAQATGENRIWRSYTVKVPSQSNIPNSVASIMQQSQDG